MVIKKSGVVSTVSADVLSHIVLFHAIPFPTPLWLDDTMSVHFYTKDAKSILQLQAFNQKSVYLHQNKFLIIF